MDNNTNINNINEESDIDWKEIFGKLLPHWKLFLISAVVTIAIAAPLILTIPKYYKVEVKLTPELGSSSNKMGGLSSLMNSFGIGGATASDGSDAIGPLLYPDLMNSQAFIVSLFDIPVCSQDGKIATTYYEYLAKDQKAPVWSKAMKGLASLFPHKKDSIEGKAKFGALTMEQDAIAQAISKNVVCDVDKKTGVITIDVTDQDPVICARVADLACKRLQQFITEYRSKKYRLQMINAELQYNKAKKDYEAAKNRVEAFNDSNWDLVDQDMIVEQQDLQNKMQMAFQVMTTFNNQVISARSKYESSIPVYTVLDGASVPLKPAGPKRSQFLLIILVLVLAAEVGYILYKDKLKAAKATVREAISQK